MVPPIRAVCCLVVDAPVVHVVLDMPVVVQRQAGYGPDSAENCLEVPQVQYLRGCGRRFDLAATPGKCLRLVHPVDVQVLRRVILLQFCSIFRPPSIWT